MKNQKGISLIALLVIIVIIILGIILISSNSNGYEMDISSGEALAYTRLRVAIANSRLNGSGILSSEDFNILGKMAKNADRSNQWFSGSSGVFYGNTADTSDYEVSWISNGQYCAIFYAKKVDDTYYLTNYTFTADTIKGYMIFVGE